MQNYYQFEHVQRINFQNLLSTIDTQLWYIYFIPPTNYSRLFTWQADLIVLFGTVIEINGYLILRSSNRFGDINLTNSEQLKYNHDWTRGSSKSNISINLLNQFCGTWVSYRNSLWSVCWTRVFLHTSTHNNLTFDIDLSEIDPKCDFLI